MRVVHVALVLGQVLATPGALEALAEAGFGPQDLLRRHAALDWGDLDAEDIASNNWAVTHKERILSAYNLPTGKKVWIITEWDRSVTTLLLPDEY